MQTQGVQKVRHQKSHVHNFLKTFIHLLPHGPTKSNNMIIKDPHQVFATLSVNINIKNWC